MSGDNELLQPGIPIKPKVTQDDIKKFLRDVYGLQCVSIKELNGYDDNNYHIHVDEKIDNKHIKTINRDGYTLKVVNNLDSQKPDFLQAQNEVLLHLEKNGFFVSKPVKDKNGNYLTLQNFTSGAHIVRLLEFISGTILHQAPPSDDLFYQCGKYVAKLDDALKSFRHPVYDTHTTIWLMSSVPKLNDFLFAISDERKIKLVKEVVQEFSTRVLPIMSKLEKGMIHGDFNEQNVIVDQKMNDEWYLKAVLDFGDCNYGCYLYELAITMTYMMLQGKSIDVGGHVLAGYHSVRRIPIEEYNLLKVCVAARLCQSLVLGAYTSLQDPSNSYILTTSVFGWQFLEELWKQPEEKVLQHWKNISKININS